MSDSLLSPLEPVVVGVLYPPEWYGDPQDFAAEVSALEAIDPRVEVVVESYVEPHDLRTARGREHDAALRDLAPALSDAQQRTLARVDVAVAIDLPFDVATVAPKLRWVQAVGAGTGQLQSAGLAQAGIRLTSNGGSNSIAIAEFAFGRLLAVQKQFRELDARQDQHRWEGVFGKQVAGQTLGLIGYGPINQAVAERAAAFGMRILVTRRTTGVEPAPPVERFYAVSDLHEMLGACDAVIAAVPETPETTGLMDRNAFASMQPGAFFCNVGRGSLLDEAELADALRSGALGAAALDVARTEPLPPDDPLWDAPNLYLSPHCSTSPSAMFPNLHRLVRDNLRRFLDGDPLAHEVEPERGY
jgi:phosphoglycerate dehydrogenase-like enzyme